MKIVASLVLTDFTKLTKMKRASEPGSFTKFLMEI
jgi:hypothetical protein